MATVIVSGADGLDGAPGLPGAPAGSPGRPGAAARATVDYSAAYGAFNPLVSLGLFELRVSGGHGGRGGLGLPDLLGSNDGAGGAGGAGGASQSRLTNLAFDGSLAGVTNGQTTIRAAALGKYGGDSGENGLTAPPATTAGAAGVGGDSVAQLDHLTFHLTGGTSLTLESTASGGAGGVSSTASGGAGHGGNGGDATAILQDLNLSGALSVVRLNAVAAGGSGGDGGFGGDGGDATAVIRNSIIRLDSNQKVEINLTPTAGVHGAGPPRRGRWGDERPVHRQ